MSNVVVYPLELVVTRLKVQRRLKGGESTSADDGDSSYNGIIDAFGKIYANEGGVPAFYGGLEQDTVKSIADSFFFFLAYSTLQRQRKKGRPSEHILIRILEQIGTGMVAGAFSKLLTTPISIIVTRKQVAAMASAKAASDDKPKMLGRKLSVRQIAEEVYRKKGLAGFWSGYSATLLLTLNPSLTFFLDAFFRRILKVRKHSGLLATFLLAATAKAIASTVLYPLSLAKSRAQAAGASSDEIKGQTKGNRPNVISTIYEMANEEGIAALYAGLIGEVLKGFFSHGLTMLVKERVQPLVIKLYYLLASLMRTSRPQKF